MTSKDYIQFPIIKANNISIAGRKKIEGVGINDAYYQVTPMIDGKQLLCPYYNTWTHMIKRSYSKKHQIKSPTYIGCSVVSEWHSFMAFRSWMEKQDWQGKELDKDIRNPGNKVYGPDTCVFVSAAINMLLTNRKAGRGKYPQGVYFHKEKKKFAVKMKMNGKNKHLGYFDSVDDASKIYRNAKRLHLLTIACCETDIRVKRGLYRHSETFR